MRQKTKNMEFPTKYTESVKKGTFESFTKPSMTEPDNSMSIPEIIARFTRGQGISVTQHPWEIGSAPEGDKYIHEEDWHDIVPGLPAPAAPAAPAEPAEPAEPAKE